jgi:hypothetical protein
VNFVDCSLGVRDILDRLFITQLEHIFGITIFLILPIIITAERLSIWLMARTLFHVDWYQRAPEFES